MGYIEERENAYHVEIERDSGERISTRAVIDDDFDFKEGDYIFFSYETDIKVSDRVYITDPRLPETHNKPLFVGGVKDEPDKESIAKLVTVRFLSEVRKDDRVEKASKVEK